MITLFLPDHPETVALTLHAATIISWALLFMPVSIIGSIFFSSLEKAGSSLLVELASLVFTLGGLAVFPPLRGTIGIWLAPVFAEVATALVTFFLLYRSVGLEKGVFVKQALTQ